MKIFIRKLFVLLFVGITLFSFSCQYESNETTGRILFVNKTGESWAKVTLDGGIVEPDIYTDDQTNKISEGTHTYFYRTPSTTGSMKTGSVEVVSCETVTVNLY